MSEEQLDLLDALIYADIFDCAATADELWRYCRVPIDRESFLERVREPSLRRVVVERDGLFAFADRRQLLDLRPERIDRSRALERRARRVASWLGLVPFVRTLALTGSAAAGNAMEGADVDLLVVVASGRLGTVFLLLGSASRLLGRRLFCPNYYVAETSLAARARTLYVARELVQARPLSVGEHRLWDSNPWLADTFPNACRPGPPASPGRPSRLQRFLETSLRGRFGDWLERRARDVARSRLRVHYRNRGACVPRDVTADFEAGAALRFHHHGLDDRTLDRYDTRRAEIAAQLAEGAAA